MDDAELVRAGVQGTVAGAITPLARLIEDALGPAAKSIGRTLEIRAKRLEEKTREMYGHARGERHPVPVNLLVAVIQYGAREENDDLQDLWAALLVNSSMSTEEMPSAPDILRQLTIHDVLLLQMCFDAVRDWLSNHRSDVFHVDRIDVSRIVEIWKDILVQKYGYKRPIGGWHPDPEVWALTLENLIRLGLVQRNPDAECPLALTNLGYRFVGLCQKPE